MNVRLDEDTLDALIRSARGRDGIDDEDIEALVAELRERRQQAEVETRLRINQAALMQLARSEAIGAGDLECALREITETAAKILGVARSSVWRYNHDHTQIVSLELFRADERVHESGVELAREQFPAYFDALLDERIIAADDAHSDPRTSEFSQVYLAPLGINSMLDAPIRVGGRMVGVICNEHTGAARTWTAAEQQFAAGLADFIALAIESHERQQTEAKLRSMIEVAEQRLETIERQRLAIADLSAPIIDVWEGILALPIVGLVDSQRSIELTERLLDRIASSGARSVIVDLTGVDVVDTMTANHLLQMIGAAGLLGAFCVLSGISPLIAQTLVQLQVDLTKITTVRNLEEALKICLRRRMHERKRSPARH